jgi:hypothetical protein
MRGVLTRPDVADFYHELLETVSEIMNDATDDDKVTEAINSGLFYVFHDILICYADYNKYYLSISNPLLSKGVNTYAIN